MGFPRQEYWSVLPFPFAGDLPDPGIKPKSPALQEDSLPSKPPRKPQKRHRFIEQSFRLCGRRRGWDVSREQHRNMYTIKGETDHQPRLDA